MKRLLFVLLGSLSTVCLHASANETPRGTVVELHSCELYAGGCTVSSEATQGGRYMLRVWDFSGGHFNGAEFKGLQVAVLQSSSDNLAARDSNTGEAVVYLPQSASESQRDALLAWVKTSVSDFHPEKLHARTTPLELKKTDAGVAFSAGRFVSLQTKALEACDSRSCGEELWYEPRAATSVFTVAVNRASTVSEPLLKITWRDSAQRSVFLGRFGDAAPGREVFVTMNEFCGASKLF